MQKLSDLSPEQRLDLGERLRQMPDNEKQAFIESLTPDQRREMIYDPILHLRRKQYVDLSDNEKNITLITSGRGK